MAIRKNGSNNGKEQKEMVTRIHCAWNQDHVVEESARHGLFGWKPAHFPDRWQFLEGEMLCEHCAEVAQDSLKQARERCANTNGSKQKSSSTS